MNLKNILTVPAALVLVASMASCGDPKKSARGFRLPEGDIEKGKQAFVALGCHRCHSVDGVELPKFEGDVPQPFTMELGGEVHKVKTHGQLVSSIIFPDHVVSKSYLNKIPKEQRGDAKEDSPMPGANDTMTVTQMIDIVAFLQPHYIKILPEDDYYGP